MCESVRRMIRKTSKRTASGVPGVYKCARSGQWRAYIYIDDKRHSIGRYKSVEEAQTFIRIFVESVENGINLHKFKQRHGGGRQGKSGTKYVTWSTARQTWLVVIPGKIPKERIRCGSARFLEDAIVLRDMHIRKRDAQP